MRTAEEILDSKRSMDFLKGAKRLLVIACIEEFKENKPRCENCGGKRLLKSRKNNRVYCLNKGCKHKSIIDAELESRNDNVSKQDSIFDLKISVRAFNVIRSSMSRDKFANLTVEKLYNCDLNKIYCSRGCGSATRNEIDCIFKNAGLK